MKMISTNSRAVPSQTSGSEISPQVLGQSNGGFVADYFNSFLGRDPGAGASTMQDFHFTMQDFNFLPAVQLGALPAVQAGALPAVQIDVLPAVQIDVLPAVQNFATDWLWG